MATMSTGFSLQEIKSLKLHQIRDYLPNIALSLSRSDLEVILYELKGCVLTAYTVSMAFKVNMCLCLH